MMAGEFTRRLILKGFFFEGRSAEKEPMGETQSLESDAYDLANKNFISNVYSDDGRG
jgi:hypothetical protein